MNSPGSGHVHGGRDGRMSFEHEQVDVAELVAEETEVLREGDLTPSERRKLDAEAEAYFREKLEARSP